MANLVAWASGLLEVMANKDTPVDTGPVVIARGPETRMKLLAARGELHKSPDGVHVSWFVPGCAPIPEDPEQAGAVQRRNMDAVIAFAKKINGVRGDGE